MREGHGSGTVDTAIGLLVIACDAAIFFWLLPRLGEQPFWVEALVLVPVFVASWFLLFRVRRGG